MKKQISVIADSGDQKAFEHATWLHRMFGRVAGVSASGVVRLEELDFDAVDCVLGFELSESTRRLLGERKCSYLDFRIHPVRYLDDVFFSLETNDPALRRTLQAYRVSESLLRYQADLVRATCRKTRKRKETTARNTLLLIGQTERDRVVFDGENYLSPLDRIETLEPLAAQYDSLLFKPHPYAKNSRHIHKMLKRRLGRVEVTHDNVYHLLSNDAIRHVVGLNSSVLYEAEYFGKEVTFLYEPTFDFEKQEVGIYGDYWNSSFWADLLGVEDAGVGLPFVPNRLRKALNDFWGYNEISDEIVLRDILKSKIKRVLSRYIR